ncbi:MAG: hypothetical protein V4636_00800 [Pseudomonadota bacterium]
MELDQQRVVRRQAHDAAPRRMFLPRVRVRLPSREIRIDSSVINGNVSLSTWTGPAQTLALPGDEQTAFVNLSAQAYKITGDRLKVKRG